MFKRSLTCLIIVASIWVHAQDWQAFTDSIPTLSSPRSADLNNDGIADIVIGGGTDGVASNNGIMAYNGVNGSLLWKRSARNEVFGSAIFQDITADGIKDVFIVGRSAQLLSINGSNGNLIWDYFPYGTNPVDSGLYNFYNPQFIHDVDGDSYPDILVSNGGDHAAPAWEENRPAGRLMVISSLTGDLIAQDTVPDGAEIYCSPLVLDIQNDGNKWIVYGTGGENYGGHFYVVPLNDLLLNNSLAGSTVLASDPNKGFIAPPSAVKKANGVYDIYIQAYGGKVTKVSGEELETVWTYQKPGTESSAAPTIGNFTGDLTPDLLVVLLKGEAPAFTDYYQVVLDGNTGEVSFLDSLGTIHFASGNAVDLNNDGRDEAVFAITYFEAGAFRTRIEAKDFVNNTLTNLDQTRTGVTLGSTPLIADLDADGLLDLVYSVKKDSTNPMGWKGIYVFRKELTSIVPNAGVAWGSYMGNKFDGVYNNELVNCGAGSVIASVLPANPACNGTSTGSISVNVVAGNGPYTYVWSTGSTASSITGLPAGNYWVQVTNSNNCFETRNITLIDPIVISFGGIVAPTCIGDSNGMATLSSTHCNCMFSGCTFLWENGGTAKPNDQLHEGWNSVAVTHPGGCVVVDSVFIPSPPPVVDSVVYLAVTACYGDETGSAIVYYDQATLPVTLTWSNGAIDDTLTSLPAGDYYVIAEDGRPCRDSIAFTIIQPEELQFSVNATHSGCAGENDGSIEFTAIGGTGALSYFVNGISSLNPLQTNLAPDTYAVHVQDANGCTAPTQPLTITEPSALVITLSGTIASGPSSQDGSAQVSITGGTAPYSITWNDPNEQTGANATQLNPGWYTASVVDANGCTMEDSVYIETLDLDETTDHSLTFFPNPATDKIHLSEHVTELTVFDAKGAMVLQQKNLFGVVKLDLASGMYTLELRSETGVKLTKLLISREE